MTARNRTATGAATNRRPNFEHSLTKYNNNMVLTDNTPKTQHRGFRKALDNVRHGDYKEVVAELYKAIGINNRVSFYAYRDGVIEPKATQAEAIVAVFNRFGINTVWDR